ncbi:hypothetical protein PENTCL1PPCAC_9100 [Pristionchus entomophagus]|uniref:RING-type domain-containing protein n=1 Tax=Pristionchus entomophagus TaxID=358040 RepID=A0AAV5T3K4_9BILA|nr:hypothetical protein PENTCL1PPCAC_9100 [Pristionchus entomophagus]
MIRTYTHSTLNCSCFCHHFLLSELKKIYMYNTKILASVYDEDLGPSDFYLMTVQLPNEYVSKSKKLEPIEHKEKVTRAVAEEPEQKPKKYPKDSDVNAFNIDDLSDQCCCSICSETFDAAKFIPRVLDCGHTFCEMCIANDKISINES